MINVLCLITTPLPYNKLPHISCPLELLSVMDILLVISLQVM